MNSSCGVRPSCATSVCRSDQFGPLYNGTYRIRPGAYQLLQDQLDIYRDYQASWALWPTRTSGCRAWCSPPPSPYMVLLKDFLAKKERLGADSWGGTDDHIRAVVDPVESLLAREFPDFNPYRGARRSGPRGCAASHPYLRGTDTGIRRAVPWTYPH